MHKEEQRLDRQAGISYVELLVVIVIIAIVASLALMQRGNANEQFQRQNAATELKIAFERARFDSVKRRAVTEPSYAGVIVSANAITLKTENNGNAVTTDAADSVTTALPAGIVIERINGETLPVTVNFNMRGETIVPSGSVQFRVCKFTCGSPTAATANLLVVTPTGTVNLLPGDAQPPTFANPTQPDVTSGIRIDAVLP